MRIASVRREQGVETFDMLSLEEHLKSFCNEYDADMAKKLSREQESTKHEKALLDSHDAIPIRPAMMKQSKLGWNFCLFPRNDHCNELMVEYWTL